MDPTLIRSSPDKGGSLQTFVIPALQRNLGRIDSHSSEVIGFTWSAEKYGLPSRFPCLFAYAASLPNISGGGKYHRWSFVKYLRVAAFFTPHASFEEDNGKPERCHSCRSQSLSVIPSILASFRYCTHTSVTTGNLRNVFVFEFPATCEIPLSQMWKQTYSQPCLTSSG